MLVASAAQPASFRNGRIADSGKDRARLALSAPAIGAGLSGHQAIKLKLLSSSPAAIKLKLLSSSYYAKVKFPS